MPPDPENRAELLERIITTGTKRRRHRRAMLGGALLALVAVVAVPLAWPDDGGRDEVTVVDDPDDSTTISSSSSSSTSSSTTAATVVETTTPVEEATTTTEAPPICRNSHDPRCGDFYWDYDPATFPNQPLTITISHEPQVVVAGEPVSFTVTFHDPEGGGVGGGGNCAQGRFEGARGSRVNGGSIAPDGGVPVSCVTPACAGGPARYGPWDPPPAPADRGPVAHEFDLIYPDPGTFLARFEDSTDFWCQSFHGYDSTGNASVLVEVIAPPP